MATIVKHLKNYNEYIFLSAGFGAYKSSRPSLFLGNLAPEEDEGTIQVAAVCDAQGNISWARTEDLVVVSIDGLRVQEIL